MEVKMRRKILTLIFLACLIFPSSSLAQRYYYPRYIRYVPAYYPVYPQRMILPVYVPPPVIIVVNPYLSNSPPPVIRRVNYSFQRMEEFYKIPRSSERFRERLSYRESMRIDGIEREISEIKHELKRLSQKFEESIDKLYRNRDLEYRDYRADLEKMKQLKRELKELKQLLKELRNSN
jgi:hypothetical protein